MNSIPKILGLSAVHLVISVLAFCATFSRTMRHFDLGDTPTLIDRLGDAAVTVLWFPFFPLSRAAGFHGGSSWEMLAFFANSLLWGVFLYVLIVTWWRRSVRSPVA